MSVRIAQVKVTLGTLTGAVSGAAGTASAVSARVSPVGRVAASAGVSFSAEATVISAGNLLSAESSGFEGGTVGSWLPNTGVSTIANSSAQHRSGARSLAATLSVSTPALNQSLNCVFAIYNGSFTQPGARHTFSAWVMTPSVRNMALMIKWQDGGTTYWSGSSIISVPANTWTQLSVSINTSLTVSTFTLYPAVGGSSPGDVVYMDDAFFAPPLDPGMTSAAGTGLAASATVRRFGAGSGSAGVAFTATVAGPTTAEVGAATESDVAATLVPSGAVMPLPDPVLMNVVVPTGFKVMVNKASPAGIVRQAVVPMPYEVRTFGDNVVVSPSSLLTEITVDRPVVGFAQPEILRVFSIIPPVSFVGAEQPFQMQVDGVRIDTYAFNIVSRTGRYNIPSNRGANYTLPGRNGVVYVPNKPTEPLQTGFAMWVVGTDPLTGTIPRTHAQKRTQFESNMNTLLRTFSRKSGLLRIVAAQPDGSTRECYAELSDAVAPTIQAGGTRSELAVVFDIPSGSWQDTSMTASTSPVGASLPKTWDITELAGMTALCEDAVVTVTGPIINPRVTDTDTGAYVQLNLTLGTGDIWVVDAGAFTSRVNSADALPNTIHKGHYRYIVISPTSYGRALPQLVLSGSGGGSTTKFSVMARRKWLSA